MAIRGIDTTCLVQVEVRETKEHELALRFLTQQLLNKGDLLGIAPQVLLEFVHIVTDSRRFESPLSMSQAVDRAQLWWSAQQVVQITPATEVTALTLTWLKEHQLGRKRLLDTQLAATYHLAGINTIISSNVRDFSIFGCFTVIDPSQPRGH